MTRDEAMKVWLEACERSNEAWFEAGEQPNDPEGDAQSRFSNEAAATVIQQAFAERDGEMREALAPIMDWYQSDEHEPRKLADIAADAVADLQSDRADTLRYAAALRTIADAPAWGAPERFDVTPAEVRQLARQALAAKGDSRG